MQACAKCGTTEGPFRVSRHGGVSRCHPCARSEASRKHYQQHGERRRQQVVARRAFNRGRTDAEVRAAQMRLRPDGTKRCRGGHTVAVELFNRKRSAPDGLDEYCGDCAADRVAARRYGAYLTEWSCGGVVAERCYLCGGHAEHVEHVVPVTLNGSVVLPACAPCNLSKNATPLDVWLRGRLVPYSEELRYAFELNAAQLYGEAVEPRTPRQFVDELGHSPAF